MGKNLFEICYPKSFKNSNKFGVSTLLIMVKRGHEVDLEYSKKKIIDKMKNEEKEYEMQRFIENKTQEGYYSLASPWI